MTEIKKKALYLIKLGPTNVYLLKIESGYLLIDTSFPQYYSSFCEYLKNINVRISDIKYLFLTHHHDDHAGFVSILKKESGCRLIVHREGIPALSEGKIISKNKTLNRRVKLIMGIFNKIKKRDFSIKPVVIDNNDIIIDKEIDSDILPSIGIKGKILHTIGHSIDSITLITDDGEVFSGDISMNFLNICGLNYRPIFLSDMNLVLNSWNLIINNLGKKVYPSHGKSFSINELIKSRNKYSKILNK